MCSQLCPIWYVWKHFSWICYRLFCI